MKTAIQGIKGSFHHQVAQNFFDKNVALQECLTFEEMPKLLIDKKVTTLIMAIENSIAGSILANYKLIDQFNLNIIGEFYLPIEHQLMALPNQKMKDIKEIWSHPMAINQCRKFLRKYPHIKIVETVDTAFAAKEISFKKQKGIACIASKIASEIYELPIIAKDIHTNPENYTRFFILDTADYKKSDFNKVSLKFITKHQMGSLSEVLQILVKNQLNLTKIQSLPIESTPWQYAFFADVVFNDPNSFYQAKEALLSKDIEVKILGKYQNTK